MKHLQAIIDHLPYEEIMSEEEKLEWYDVTYVIMSEELNENPDLIVTGAFYWCDEVYNNMDWQTKKLCMG